MMRKFPFLLAFGLIYGCGADAQNDPDATPQAFSELHAGNYLMSGEFTNKKTEVLTTAESYRAALAGYSEEQPIAIDFSANRVLLVNMGQRPTGGYDIQVTSVEVEDDKVIAQVTLAKPGENCAVTEALSNPYQFVAIHTAQEILVREELITQLCSDTGQP